MINWLTVQLAVVCWVSVIVVGCPQNCTCNAQVILCNAKAFSTFPTNIPTDTVLLDLRNNLIQRISKADLNNLNQLEILLISHNRIRLIDENVLDEVPKLKRLYLSQNRIEQLPLLSSRIHKNLRHLDLHTNRIVKIPENFFNNFININTVDLSNNYLQTLSETNTRNMEIKKLYLEQNPLNCDCRWIRAQTYLKERQGKADLLCYSPHHLRYQNLLELDAKHLRCHKTKSKIVGNSKFISCSVSGHTVEWLYRGRNLDDEYNGEYEILANGTLSVPISVDTSDFQCAINHYLNPKRRRRQLFSSSKPKFLIKPKSRSYPEGTLVRLVCQAIGTPTPSINWLMNGIQIKDGRKYEFRDNKTTLVIFPFLESEIGRYTCTAENIHGWIQASADIGLTVSIPPQIIQPPKSITITEGETAMFTCTGIAEPKPTITWSFDGKTIPVVKGHYRVSDNGTVLTVEHVTRRDSGVIGCMVGNSVGSMTADARLVVKPPLVEPPVYYPEDSKNFELKELQPSLKLKDIMAVENEISKVTSPKQLLKWLQFTKALPSDTDKIREVYEESIQLLRRLISKGLILSLNKMSKTISFDTLLPQPNLDALIQLTGCSVTQIKDSCSNECFNARYRSMDGQCNNRNQTGWGASHIPFQRLLPPAYENGFNTPIGSNRNYSYFGYPKPNPRIVSKLLFEAPNITPHENLSSMIMQWGQFIDHDIDLIAPSVSRDIFTDGQHCNVTCENKNPCFNIPLPSNDPKLRSRQKYPCIEFERSSPVCGSGETSLIYGQITHREQMNTITSFIDGSAIYGSTDEDVFGVRDMDSDGLLRYDILSASRKPYLPFDTDSAMDCRRNKSTGHAIRCFLAGDVRANEQLGLLSIHTIMMREHNRVAMRFAQQNPRLDSEIIFQESRKIVGAEIQHITFNHWLPKVFGAEQYEKLIGPYKGYDPEVDPSVSNAFATAAFRFGHSLVNPVLYRLDRNFHPYVKGHIPLREAFFSPETIISDGIDPILRGLFASPMKKPLPRQLVTTELTEELFNKAHHVPLDLMALNVQRGRDHGLPSYLEYRRWCNLTEINKWEDLRAYMTEEVIIRLRQLYGHPGNIDLFVGGMTENRLNGSLFGPTFACIIADQFRRLRQGDRFWYENEGVFTADQLKEIKKTSLARILCDNSDDIRRIQNDIFTYPGPELKHYDECRKLPRMDFTPWRRCCYRHCTIPRDHYKLNHKRRRSAVNVCEHNGKFFRNKQTWRFHCSICRCQEGTVECREDRRCIDQHYANRRQNSGVKNN